jgi:hypothetical protein
MLVSFLCSATPFMESVPVFLAWTTPGTPRECQIGTSTRIVSISCGPLLKHNSYTSTLLDIRPRRPDDLYQGAQSDEPDLDELRRIAAAQAWIR